jgi:hypothetical protein
MREYRYDHVHLRSSDLDATARFCRAPCSSRDEFPDDVPALPDQPNASDTGTQTCRNPATFS